MKWMAFRAGVLLFFFVMQSNENTTRPLNWPPADYNPAIPVMDWALLTDSEIGERLFAAESVLTLIAFAARSDDKEAALPHIATAAEHINRLLDPLPDMFLRLLYYNGIRA